MYILGLGHKINLALRNLVFNIFESLLKGINSVYNLFFTIIEYDRWMENETIKGIFFRIELILGLFMIFRLTFSAIQYVIEPDNMSDKEKGLGNIIKKVLITVALLGSVHYIFNFANTVQNEILGLGNNDSSIIEKIILGPSNTMDAPEANMSWAILDAFYEAPSGSDCELTDVKKEKYIIAVSNNEKDIFTDEYNCLERDEDSDNWTVDFQWLFGIATAVVVLWILLTYTIQMGIRGLQLAYLEIISPIPIMMYLNPKGGDTLKKWGNQCLVTYVDVFLRIAIIDFVIVCFQVISEIDFANESKLVGIVLLIALLMFAKRVPDLIKEIFPSLGGAAALDLGIKSPKKLYNDVKSMPVLGAAVGAAAKLGKFAGKTAWKHTGGRAVQRVKNKYNNWDKTKENKEAYNTRRRETESFSTADERDNFKKGNYGNMFKSKDFTNALTDLDKAKDEAINDKGYAKGTAEYEAYIKSAKEAFELQKSKNLADSRKFDAINDYDKYHPQSSLPTSTTTTSSSNSPPRSTTTTTPSGIVTDNSTSHPRPNQQNNQTSPTESNSYSQTTNNLNDNVHEAERERVARQMSDSERNN